VNSPFELLSDARNIPTISCSVSVSGYLWIIGCGCAFGEIERTQRKGLKCGKGRGLGREDFDLKCGGCDLGE